MDKLYVMASNESLAHFMRNPRPFLAPHLPCPPCKVCVLGPPHSGKTVLAQSLAQRYNAKVKMGQQWYRSPFCKWFSHGLWRKAAFCIVVLKGSYQSPRIPYRGLIRHVVEGGSVFQKNQSGTKCKDISLSNYHSAGMNRVYNMHLFGTDFSQKCYPAQVNITFIFITS